MARYVLRRIAVSLPILLGVTVITFIFVNLVPGDYIDSLIDPETSSATREDYEALEEQLGLNQPAPVRYVRWLEQTVKGNLGYSLATRKPVRDEIMRRLPTTLKLTATSLVFAMSLGVVLGIASALRPYSWLDYFLTFWGFVWISVPSFFAAMGAIYLLAIKFPILPVAGTGPRGVADVPLHVQLEYLLLPAGILGLERVAGFMRYARSSMLDVLGQDYVTVARAKGLRPARVVSRHAFRNALLPLITVIGLSLPSLIGGSVVIEAIFGWEGIGTMSLTAVTQRDYPVILGVNLVVAIMVLGSNLLADLAYGAADPRIRNR
jgi:peptide/nickel transport system permease protein